MTQAELAHQAGVGVETVGNLETAKRWPRSVSLSRIEAALGWTSGKLLRIALEGMPNIDGSPTTDEEKLYQMLKDLPPLEFQALFELVRAMIREHEETRPWPRP